MESAQGFFRYQIKRHNENCHEYGYYCFAKRLNNKKINIETYLGKVINKDKNIFYTRKEGFYIYNNPNEKIYLDDKSIFIKEISDNIKVSEKKEKRSRSVVFGSIYIFNEFFKSSKLNTVFSFADDINTDTLYSLILYRILNSNGYSRAFDWWNETYAKFVYPNALMQSQRISEFFEQIGQEKYHRLFFANYMFFLQNINPKFNLLIDSTGLENVIRIPITAINNHNNVVTNEIRLLMAADKISGLPIYYRYVPGNIVDVTTLSLIINELKEYKINIDRAILDAGYYSENNVSFLIDNKIPFMTRLTERTEIYDLLVKKFAPNLCHLENMVKFGERILFIKRSTINSLNSSRPLNYYICLDIERQSQEKASYFKHISKNKTDTELENDLLRQGIFILVTSLNLEINDVLPCYYDRQAIEQVFDYIKGSIDLIPLRCHNEDTLAGHLFISFLATIGYLTLDKLLKKHKNSLTNSLESLGRLHCRVYMNKIVPDIPTKKVNDVLKAIKLKIPDKIILSNNDISNF
jgi:transposase